MVCVKLFTVVQLFVTFVTQGNGKVVEKDYGET